MIPADREYVRAIPISRRDTQLEMAIRLEYILASAARPLQGECDELRRMLRALQGALLKPRLPRKSREQAPSP